MGRFLSISSWSTRVGVMSLIFVNLFFVVQVTKAQPSQAEILSVDCGSETSHTDPVTTIQWKPDSGFISTGYNAQVQSNNLTDTFSELTSLRFFNDTAMAKHCYSLPVTDNRTYSLRAMFYYGTSDAAGPDAPTFQLALDGTVVANVTTYRSIANYYEHIYRSRGNVTFLCLLRDGTQAVPFISAISLRPAVMYQRFAGYLADNKYIQTSRRLNFGGTDRVRFPTDVHDRIWNPVGPNSTYLANSTSPVQILSTTHKMNLSDYGTGVPEVVLQTAVTVQGNFSIEGLKPASSHLILHFAELDNHTSHVSRKFMVHVPSVAGDVYVNPWNYSLQPYKPMMWYFSDVSFTSANDNKIVFYPKPRSRLGPLLNALELYSLVDTTPYTTSAQDVKAIEAVKQSMNLTEWAGDPCLPVPHAWLSCTAPDATLQQRVDQLSLSGYNLQGTVPASTLALLDVTSLSLDNNALTGTFPDLSSMTTLTQLHLHDNQLSGPLPDWLATTRNLQKLSIQNNNFSGIIPAQLLAGNSMNFTYRPGNPLLIEQGSTSNTTQGSTGTKPDVHAAAYIFITIIILEILQM